MSVISGCFNSSDSDTNSTKQEQSSNAEIFEAPFIENLPEMTQEDSVSITLRTRPDADIYLNKSRVATSDSKGVAVITLPMLSDKTTTSFELIVRDGNMKSEALYFSIKKQNFKEEDVASSSVSKSSSSSLAIQVSSLATQSSSVASSVSSSLSGVIASAGSSVASYSSQTVVIPSSSSPALSASSSSLAVTPVTSSSSSELTNPITQISLSSASLELAEGNTSVLHVNAIYQNTTTQTLTSNLQWIITNPKIIAIQNQTLKALKEGETTLKARYQNLTSQSLHVRVYKEIHGHRLPPEPDKTLNDSTLLGVDVNHNDVRDDVERWIYETYKDKHPIYIDIAMQAARGYKLVLETPEKAKEIHGYATAYLDCMSYYSTYAKYFNEPVLIKDDSGVNEYFRSKIYFNTLKRKASYDQYDRMLSGDSYSLPKIENLKSLCDFNTSKY